MNVSATDIQLGLQQLGGLPTPVSSWQVETGLDATDDPAVWVWAWLQEDEVDRHVLSSLRNIVRKEVRRKVPGDVWVYTRFPRASEQKPAQ